MNTRLIAIALLTFLPFSNCAGEENSILGDWAIITPTGEAAWLSVSMENGKPHAELMWAVGGVRVISDFLLEGSRLAFDRKRKGNPQTFEFSAEGEQLSGVLTSFDKLRLSNLSRQKFTGKRMPPLPPKPDLSKIKFGPKQVLFNGEDLTGWKVTDKSKKNGWSVKNGVMVNDTPKTDFSAYGDHANLRTEKEFEDFRLHIEFQPPSGGNSGVYLRGMYEVQVVDRDSKMQGLQGVGSIFGRIKAIENAGKPGGEWNVYDITLVDRHVTVVLNGETVIDNQPVAGPTGGAIQSDVTKPGPIYLQGDHTSVKYRNIWIEPVVK
ncbi:MAG: DUF1080 domain-containing protein [Planctomycetaceae bacterium]|nr:DUF1080 domain-containing protein [Planctomycetaceae bacterium]